MTIQETFSAFFAFNFFARCCPSYIILSFFANKSFKRTLRLFFSLPFLVPRRDTETSEFIEDLKAQIRELTKANEALKNKVLYNPHYQQFNFLFQGANCRMQMRFYELFQVGWSSF